MAHFFLKKEPTYVGSVQKVTSPCCSPCLNIVFSPHQRTSTTSIKNWQSKLSKFGANQKSNTSQSINTNLYVIALQSQKAANYFLVTFTQIFE